MTNLTTFQSRAYASFVYIDGDVHRSKIDFGNINYTHLFAGIMAFVWLLILVGRLATSPQAAMLADLMQAVTFSSKILVIVVRAMAWGVLGT